MRKAYKSSDVNRMIALLKCLAAIADDDKLTVLSSIGFQSDISDTENERINAIYEHTLSHFKRKIMLDEIASVAGMTPNSFAAISKSEPAKHTLSF